DGTRKPRLILNGLMRWRLLRALFWWKQRRILSQTSWLPLTKQPASSNRPAAVRSLIVGAAANSEASAITTSTSTRRALRILRLQETPAEKQSGPAFRQTLSRPEEHA